MQVSAGLARANHPDAVRTGVCRRFHLPHCSPVAKPPNMRVCIIRINGVKWLLRCPVQRTVEGAWVILGSAGFREHGNGRRWSAWSGPAPTLLTLLLQL